jgi:hypothetical protein
MKGRAMTPEEVVRESIRAYNAGDRAGYAKCVTEDFTYAEYCTGRELHGEDALDACFGWKEAWPDLEGSVERIAAAGDVVVWQTVWRGHQTGPLTLPDGRVVPPSGAATEVPGCQVVTLRDGRMRRIDPYFDALGFMMAIGAIPVPATV